MDAPRRARRRRLAAAALVVAWLPLTSIGCFGRFQLLRNVYTFNEEITPDPWMRWFVFLVLNVVPVYGLAGTIDVLLANSIEFWTGENPVKPPPGQRRRAEAPDGSVLVLEGLADGSVAVALTDASGETHRFVVEEAGPGLVALDPAGHVLARAGGLAPSIAGGAAALP